MESENDKQREADFRMMHEELHACLKWFHVDKRGSFLRYENVRSTKLFEIMLIEFIDALKFPRSLINYKWTALRNLMTMKFDIALRFELQQEVWDGNLKEISPGTKAVWFETFIKPFKCSVPHPIFFDRESEGREMEFFERCAATEVPHLARKEWLFGFCMAVDKTDFFRLVVVCETTPDQVKKFGEDLDRLCENSHMVNTYQTTANYTDGHLRTGIRLWKFQWREEGFEITTEWKHIIVLSCKNYNYKHTYF